MATVTFHYNKFSKHTVIDAILQLLRLARDSGMPQATMGNAVIAALRMQIADQYDRDGEKFSKEVLRLALLLSPPLAEDRDS